MMGLAWTSPGSLPASRPQTLQSQPTGSPGDPPVNSTAKQTTEKQKTTTNTIQNERKQKVSRAS
eukprot:3340880-Amphidinium_carterae.1